MIKGPGMLWEACVDKVIAMGGQILMGQTMKELEACDTGWKLIHEGVDGTQQVLMVDEVISSGPLRDLALHLAPHPSEAVLHAARQLRYRDFLTVMPSMETLRTAIAASYPGLHLVGRNGMHKYNNQDHAMMTAMLGVENIAAGQALYEL